MPRAAVYTGGAVLAAALSLVTALVRPSDDGATALDGAELFHVKGCATCHEGPGTPTMIGVGPSLAHAANWAGTRIEGMSAEDYLAQSMLQPSAFISPAFTGGEGPTTGMPQLQLSTDEVDALVRYLLDTTDTTAAASLDSTRGSE